MKLFVDDIRKLPDESWQLARTVSDAIRAINMFDFDVISLDHDIEGSNETFDTVALFINEKYKDRIIAQKANVIISCLGIDCPERNGDKYYHTKTPKIILHTANPVGAERMKNILNGFDVEVKELGFV